jgi:hypothetical protein
LADMASLLRILETAVATHDQHSPRHGSLKSFGGGESPPLSDRGVCKLRLHTFFRICDYSKKLAKLQAKVIHKKSSLCG